MMTKVRTTNWWFVALLGLAACGHPVPAVVPPAPPPSIAEIAQYLFSSNCNVMQGTQTTVCDNISSTGEIRRRTCTPGYSFHGVEVCTDSMYQIDQARNCIAATSEITVARNTWRWAALQTYYDHFGQPPCWLNSDMRGSIDALYTWNDFDENGNPKDLAHGAFVDRTSLTKTGSDGVLVEFYEDTTGIDPMPTTYCGVGSYTSKGLVSIQQKPEACR